MRSNVAVERTSMRAALGGMSRFAFALAITAVPQVVARSAEPVPTIDPGAAASTPSVVVQQAEGGVVLLSGSDARIRGTTLRWEPQPHKRTLGFWTRADDAAEWTFAVNDTGEFAVEVLQGCGTGQGGSEMIVTLDPEGKAGLTLRFVVEDTGGFQEFRPRRVGRLTIDTAGKHVLRIKPERIAKHAACDIREVRLIPVQPAAPQQ